MSLSGRSKIYGVNWIWPQETVIYLVKQSVSPIIISVREYFPCTFKLFNKKNHFILSPTMTESKYHKREWLQNVLIFKKNFQTSSIHFQRRWQLRSDNNDQSDSSSYGQSRLETARHLQILLWNRRRVLSLRWADVLHEVRFVDIRRLHGMYSHTDTHVHIKYIIKQQLMNYQGPLPTYERLTWSVRW